MKNRVTIELGICLVVLLSLFISGVEGQDKEQSKRIDSITADFRITKADGTKSLTQLMAEQNPQVIPQNRKLASLYFIVSAEGDSLILNGSSTTPGFQLVVGKGDDKLFPLSPLPFDADELLAGATAKTNGTCDFFVHIELAP